MANSYLNGIFNLNKRLHTNSKNKKTASSFIEFFKQIIKNDEIDRKENFGIHKGIKYKFAKLIVNNEFISSIAFAAILAGIAGAINWYFATVSSFTMTLVITPIMAYFNMLAIGFSVHTLALGIEKLDKVIFNENIFRKEIDSIYDVTENDLNYLSTFSKGYYNIRKFSADISDNKLLKTTHNILNSFNVSQLIGIISTVSNYLKKTPKTGGDFTARERNNIRKFKLGTNLLGNGISFILETIDNYKEIDNAHYNKILQKIEKTSNRVQKLEELFPNNSENSYKYDNRIINQAKEINEKIKIENENIKYKIQPEFNNLIKIYGFETLIGLIGSTSILYTKKLRQNMAINRFFIGIVTANILITLFQSLSSFFNLAILNAKDSRENEIRKTAIGKFIFNKEGNVAHENNVSLADLEKIYYIQEDSINKRLYNIIDEVSDKNNNKFQENKTNKKGENFSIIPENDKFEKFRIDLKKAGFTNGSKKATEKLIKKYFIRSELNNLTQAELRTIERNREPQGHRNFSHKLFSNLFSGIGGISLITGIKHTPLITVPISKLNSENINKNEGNQNLNLSR